MPIYGWDASDFDWGRGPMDVAAAARSGIQFFTHKATESTNVKHVYFGEAMHRARDAGIPFLGAYHVVRSPRNARDEVDYFLNYVDKSFPEWRSWDGYFIQVDLEKWPYDAVPAAEGEDFADLAQAQTGKAAVIYASKGQYGDALVGTSHELWNANYPLSYQTGGFQDLYRRAGGDNGPGWASYSGKTPVFWQYTSSATIGSQPGCDANAFRGSLDELRALITGGEDMTPDQAAKLDRVERILTAMCTGPSPAPSPGQPWYISGKDIPLDTTWSNGPKAVPNPTVAVLDAIRSAVGGGIQVAGQPDQAQVDAAILKAMQDPTVLKGIGDAIAAHLHVN